MVRWPVYHHGVVPHHPGVGAPLTDFLVVVASSYAIGCVSGAYYILRLRRGADIRTLGSGTAGARNMLRVSGKGAAVATFLVDLAKGAAAILLARALSEQNWAPAVAFAFVVLGHVFPAQLSFRGGKGISPALGGMLVLDPMVALMAVAVGVLAGLAARSATVFALTAIAVAAPVSVVRGHGAITIACIAAACVLVLVAHHPAFDRLRPPPKLAVQEHTS